MKDFDKKLERLQEISETIKDSDVGLEVAAGLFEEGITLANELEKQLNTLENKIEILIENSDPDGEAIFSDFEE